MEIYGKRLFKSKNANLCEKCYLEVVCAVLQEIFKKHYYKKIMIKSSLK